MLSNTRERFSGGHVASVYRATDGERRLFPNSDLVRVDKIADPSWALRLYYRHKVAALLYPDNFIDVVGAQVAFPPPLVSTQVRHVGEIKNHSLYSRMAAVNPDHATFADHLRLVVGETPAGKAVLYKNSVCTCAVCVQHGQEHTARDMATLAQKTSDSISPSGIVPPADDPSDYCLTDRGIMFFELKSFDPNKLMRSLTALESSAPNREAALRFLNRYVTLDMQVRLEAMRGKTVGLRLTS